MNASPLSERLATSRRQSFTQGEGDETVAARFGVRLVTATDCNGRQRTAMDHNSRDGAS